MSGPVWSYLYPCHYSVLYLVLCGVINIHVIILYYSISGLVRSFLMSLFCIMSGPVWSYLFSCHYSVFYLVLCGIFWLFCILPVLQMGISVLLLLFWIFLVLDEILCIDVIVLYFYYFIWSCSGTICRREEKSLGIDFPDPLSNSPGIRRGEGDICRLAEKLPPDIGVHS